MKPTPPVFIAVATLAFSVFASDGLDRNPFTKDLWLGSKFEPLQRVTATISYQKACTLFHAKQSQALDEAMQELKREQPEEWNRLSNIVSGVEIENQCGARIQDVAAIDSVESFAINRIRAGKRVQITLRSLIQRATIHQAGQDADGFIIFIFSKDSLLTYFHDLASLNFRSAAIDSTKESLAPICSQALSILKNPFWRTKSPEQRVAPIWNLTRSNYSTQLHYSDESIALFGQLFDQWQVNYLQQRNEPTEEDMANLEATLEECRK